MARTLHRPSPALVVACIALFVALSGFGYAAIKLPRNSVGTKQLKNGAVTGKKIAKRAVSGAKIAPDAVTGDKVADNSLTGADVLESSLGRVPSASNGTTRIPPNGSVFAGPQPTNGFTYFGRDTTHLDRYLMVTCGYVGNTPTNQIECYAEVSAALG